MRFWPVLLGSLFWSFVGRVQAQDPAEMGPLSVTEWDAGSVAVGATAVPTVVVFPNEAGPRPIVGVFHGYEGESVDHQLLARTLASYGLVVIRATMPCRVLTGCDHNANAVMISGLLDWAVDQSARAGSTLEGRVDGSQRGLVGHSFGALNVHIAGSRDRSIGSVVLLDPNDDTGLPGRFASTDVTAPTAQILAALPSSCNALWDEAGVGMMVPTPNLQLTVARSAHCDPTDAADAVCMFGCGTGDRSTSAIFRRYTVAWTVCNLLGDPAMAPYLGGAALAEDETASMVRGVVANGLDNLRCRIPVPDAGITLDSGIELDAGADAGPMALDAASVDAARSDSGVDVVNRGGCACRAGAGSAFPSGPFGASAIAFLGMWARRRAARSARIG